MADVRRVRSRKLADLEAMLHEFTPGVRLTNIDSVGLHFAWASARTATMAIVDWDLRAGARAIFNPAAVLLACQMNGEHLRIGSRARLDPAAPWLCTAEPTDVIWSRNASVQALAFDMSSVERTARQISGEDHLTLRVLDPRPIAPRLARSWTSALDHVRFTLLAQAEGSHPLLDAELSRHAIRMTLATFRTTFSDSLTRPVQRNPAASTIRRAKAYMDAHAHEPITVNDVARAVSISTRGLQYAFRRAHDDTPTSYLRQARLAGADQDLRRNEGLTIAEIARRWGFSHPSRFAVYYRRQFGHSPSEIAGRRVRVDRAGANSEQE